MNTSPFATLVPEIKNAAGPWLVTGAAGFIGSHLVEQLLKLEMSVVGLDNFATGHRSNLEQVRLAVPEASWNRFRMIEGDIRDLTTCQTACAGVQYVLHEAALGSVPRSLADPIRTNESNVTGFLNLLTAARDAQVKRFVYAASSSTYGDHPGLPKVEGVIGKPLSPYAVTKYVNEMYADVFSRCYGIQCVGLRYFNVFGPRQDPNGAYAAVIPKWISAMIRNEQVVINGDGETSRDFCYIENVVQANFRAAVAELAPGTSEVFNVAVGDRTTLNQVLEFMRAGLEKQFPHLRDFRPKHGDFRAGDVRHSQADISKARKLLGYAPTHRVNQGLDASLAWYVNQTPP